MRFPICDIVPVTSPGAISTVAGGLALVAVTAGGLTPLSTAALTAQILTLVVLGATIEDQWGRLRYLAAISVAAAGGALGTDETAWAAEPAWTAISAVAGMVGGAHLSLFPRGRLAVGAGPWLLELPSFLLPGLWAVSVVWMGVPLTPAVAAAAAGAALVRWVRQRDATSWTRLDRATPGLTSRGSI